jgi:CHAT domain-containing protein
VKLFLNVEHSSAGARRRATAIAVIAAVALGVAAVAAWRRVSSPEPGAELRRVLHEARYRIVEGRLSGVPFAPRKSQFDSGPKATHATPIAVLVAANKVIENFADQTDGANLHDLGVAHILTGNSESGIAVLEKAAEQNPNDARTWSDLAVARQTTATRNSVPALLADALGAVGRALAEQPVLPEGRFNEAIVFEKLGLYAAAVRAYRSYLEVDSRSPWGEEARTRIRELERPTLREEWARDRPLLERAALARDGVTVRRLVAVYRQEARTWCETIYLADWADAFERQDTETAAKRLELVTVVAPELLQINGDAFVADALAAVKTISDANRHRLARGYLQYRAARLLYLERHVEKALARFVAAESDFVAAHSPMWFVARYYRGMALDDSGHTDEAAVMFDTLLSAIPSDHSALRAQVFWALGSTRTRRGLLHDALAAQRESLAIFRRLGEEKNSCAILTNIAATLAALGRRAEAWQLRVETFPRLSRLGDGRELQTALDAAARTEALEERWDVALPLLTEAANAAIQPNPIVYASTVLWRALAEQNLGRTSSREHLHTAAGIAETLPDPAARERARLDVKLVAAVFVLTIDPTAALKLLDEYIAGAEAQPHRLFLPEAHLLRARAWRALGDEHRSEEELRETLRQLADRGTDPLEQRSTYFRTGDEATRELVDMLVRRGDADGAFAVLANFRRRPYANTSDAAQRLRSDAVIIEYLVLRDRLLVFSAGGEGVKVTTVGVSEIELRAAADRFVDGMRAGDASAPPAALWRWLVVPVFERVRAARLLILVPDPVLRHVPFAALSDPAGRYLVEYAQIAISPASSLGANAPARQRKKIVAVGDPVLDRRFFDLPPLRHAVREAQTVVELYPKSALFTGTEATRETILDAAADADVLHFATHAVVVPRDPSASYLALAPSGTNSGALAVRDIQQATLHSKPLIVLAGCRTAAVGDFTRNAMSLAEAFLVAGATDVVGTLWDLPDNVVTRELSIRFHEEVCAGADPVAALRRVQLALIHSANPNRVPPMIWSSFQIYVAHRGPTDVIGRTCPSHIEKR